MSRLERDCRWWVLMSCRHCWSHLVVTITSCSADQSHVDAKCMSIVSLVELTNRTLINWRGKIWGVDSTLQNWNVDYFYLLFSGYRFQVALDKQSHLMDDESRHAENHQVAVDTSLKEVMTLLQGHAEKLHRKQLVKKDGSFDREQHAQVRHWVKRLISYT